ncbi:MAG: ion transporter [Methanobacterium sp.]|uniref:potassium channel family protein n=1 Tax=Methanobacterium sp. TaxID=2164 RepID=UPI003D654147|nr:ion transporter [Methanobacterium sp.]
MKKELSFLIEGIILILILTDIILLTLIAFFNVDPNIYTLIVYFDLIVVLILIPEFIYRLWKSDDKKKFLLHNWTDIIGMIPEILVGPISTIFRYFRLIRIIRILALFKKEIRHFLEFLHKTKIDYGLLIVLIILLTSTTLFFFFEFSINDDVNSFDDAFWYLLVTVTTVGYGDITPTTFHGRLIGFLIMITGIGFISFLTATIASRFVKSTKDARLDNVNKKLDKIQSELDEMKEIIKKIAK